MKYIGAVVCGAAAIMLLLFPKEVALAVGSAVSDCLEIIIPSLFAFSVLSVYIGGSAAGKVLLKPFSVPLSMLLRLDEELCGVLLLSNIGGYPVGARLLTDMVRSGRLSEENASRLMCCCYGSGPAFIIGIVGGRIYGSSIAGGIIFCACALTSLVIAMVVCRSGERIVINGEAQIRQIGFVDAVKSGASIMLTVCIMIVAFSVVALMLDIIGLAAVTGADSSLRAAVGALLEISRIKELVPAGAWSAALCGSLLSFGGVCVVAQVYALVGGSFSLKNFLLSRIPAAVLSGLLSLPVGFLSETAVECIGGSKAGAQPFSVNAVLSACVLIMSGILLYGEPKVTIDKKQSKNC